MTKLEKLEEAYELLEKAAVLLDEVSYPVEAEWVRDVANGVEVIEAFEPENPTRIRW